MKNKWLAGALCALLMLILERVSVAQAQDADAPQPLDDVPTAGVTDTDALTAAASTQPLTLTGYWENDGGVLKRNGTTDRHYTNGLGFSLAHQPQWAKALAPYVPFGESFDRTAGGYIVANLMFTPQAVGTSTPMPTDRPYAGYLFAGVYFQRANAQTMDHFQLDLGAVGPVTQTDDLQRQIHNLVGEKVPQGWNNQLENEFTAQLYLRKKWRFEPADIQWSPDAAPLQVQLIPAAGAALGSVYRNLEGGATLRLGFNLPDDFGPGRLQDVAAATGSASRGWGVYAFGRAAGKIVEHDLFLEGNTFRSSPGVDAENFTGEVQAGFAVQYHRDNLGLDVGYSQTFQTDAFEGQRGGDAFGALTIAFTCWF